MDRAMVEGVCVCTHARVHMHVCYVTETVYTMADRKQRVWQELEAGCNLNMCTPSDPYISIARIWFLNVLQSPNCAITWGNKRPNLWGTLQHQSITCTLWNLNGASIILNQGTVNGTSEGWHLKGARVYYNTKPNIENNTVLVFFFSNQGFLGRQITFTYKSQRLNQEQNQTTKQI